MKKKNLKRLVPLENIFKLYCACYLLLIMFKNNDKKETNCKCSGYVWEQ